MIVLPHLFSPFFRQFPKSEGRILSGTMIPPLNKAASNSKVSTLLVGDKQCGNIHAFLKIEKNQSLSTMSIMDGQLLRQKIVK